MNEIAVHDELPHCVCGAPGMAFYAGTADETVDLIGQQLVLMRGVPAAAWCEDCWFAKFGDHRQAKA